MRSLLLISCLVVVGCGKKEDKLAAGPAAERAPVDNSKGELAKLTVAKLAFEAYPQWAMAHPDSECPARLEELLEYVTQKDLKDPWGGTYKMMCGSSLPAGAHGLAVSSSGADGADGTSDDVKSW